MKRGYHFFNRRYTKRLPFLSEMVYKKVKGLDHGQNFPVENFFEYPRVLFASAEKIYRHDNSSESFSVVFSRFWYYLFRICNSNFCTIQMKPRHHYSDTVLLFYQEFYQGIGRFYNKKIINSDLT